MIKNLQNSDQGERQDPSMISCLFVLRATLKIYIIERYKINTRYFFPEFFFFILIYTLTKTNKIIIGNEASSSFLINSPAVMAREKKTKNLNIGTMPILYCKNMEQDIITPHNYIITPQMLELLRFCCCCKIGFENTPKNYFFRNVKLPPFYRKKWIFFS